MRRLALALGLAVATGAAACDRVVDLTPPDGAAGPDVSFTPDAAPDAALDGPEDALGDSASTEDVAPLEDATTDAL